MAGSEPEFDRLATDYDALLKDPVRDWFSPGGGFLVSRKVDVMLALARRLGRDTRELTWLDVGCGRGELLRAAAPFFQRVIGCDVSKEMMAACPDLDVRLQPTAVEVPLPDHSVDWATAVCVYHHVDLADRARLTAEIHRVLRPGGAFLIIEHNPFNPATQVIVWRSPVDEHAVLLTARTTRRMLGDAGFGIAATQYFLYFPERIYRGARAIEQALTRVPLGGQYTVAGIKTA